MKNILILILLIVSYLTNAQNRYPDFAMGDLEIKVPASLPGLKPDAINSGFITYNLKGQLFAAGQNNIIQETAAGFNGKSDKATPYQTLTELVSIVRKSDWKAMKKLYIKSSEKELDNLIPEDKRADYFKSLNENTEVKVIGCFDYRNGILVLIENPDKSVNTAFFVKDGKKYMMQRLVDSSAMVWNLALYFRFRPQPVKPAELISKLDSVSIDAEQKLIFNTQPGNWVLLFKEQASSPVIIRVQDGDPETDFDPLPGVVEVRLNKRNLSGAKQYTISAAESNYPVYMVSDELLQKCCKSKF
jgi:hypothetical protein